MNFRKAITVRLAELDMTKLELAIKSGVAVVTIRNLMVRGGTDSVNLNTLVKIADALDMRVWVLVKEAAKDE